VRKLLLSLALLALPSICHSQTCDPLLAKHIYHAQRLHVQKACVSVTGIWQDASHGKTGDGCRHEKDGDGHCWLKLDAGQEQYLNAENRSEQDSNLVIEPIYIYKSTQPDAVAFRKGFSQQIKLPPIGAHVKVTGVWVLDAQHGHLEIHPVTSIEVLGR